MLNPQEVADKKFRSVVFGGYDMPGVDAFLETVTDDYSVLFKENAILKSKIRVLVDKLEEYRKVDSSMRQALLGAQTTAEKIKNDAQEQSDRMLKDLQSQLGARKEQLRADLELEEMRLEKARNQTITFVDKLREVYRLQIEQLAVIPTMQAEALAPGREREQAVRQTAAEIEQAVDTQLREESDGNPPPLSPPVPKAPETRTIAEGDEPRAESEVIRKQDADETAPEPPANGGEPDAGTLQAFNHIFGDKGDMTDEEIQAIFATEQDTEIPRPKLDFDGLEHQFGAGAENTVVFKQK